MVLGVELDLEGTVKALSTPHRGRRVCQRAGVQENQVLEAYRQEEHAAPTGLAEVPSAFRSLNDGLVVEP